MTPIAPPATVLPGRPVAVEPLPPGAVGVEPAALTPALREAYERSLRAAADQPGLFEPVERYCLFVGYPRSGHTIVAALMSAHRHVVLGIELDALRYVDAGFSRDQLFALLLERSAAGKGLKSYEYEYKVPTQWQGRYERLRVIGDKEGGMSSLRLRRKPELLDMLKERVGVPVVLVHIVRNPFDNIATMLNRGDADTLDQAIEIYFRFARTAAEVKARQGGDPVVEVRHEDFVRDARGSLASICGALGVEATPDYLDDCAAIVFDTPRQRRSTVPWTGARVRRVEEEIAGIEFLRGYRFEG